MFKKVQALLLSMAVAIAGVGSIHASADSYPSTSGIKGCSVPAAWYDSQSYAALPTIKADGFNTVRLVWTTSMTASRMDQYLTECDSLGLRAIVELHDATGGQDASSLSPCVNYWCRSDVLTVLYNHPNDWINVAN